MNGQKNIVQFDGFEYKRTRNSPKSKILAQIEYNDGSALSSCLNFALKVARTDLTVLIMGESGVGKENIARLVHEQSERSEERLVVVDCSTTIGTLLASSLFGHKKGSFTGAFEDKDGYFEIADSGTIFLDEVGELPHKIQMQLLRVLDKGTFTPVGEIKERRVDVRIIAATNKNLKEEVSKGRFRSDLFYRLNDFPIKVPPLRERTEDIPLLVEYFKRFFMKELEGRGFQSIGISTKAIKKMQKYNWPGNVRQLRSIVKRSIVLCQGRKEVLPEDLDLDDDIRTQDKMAVSDKFELFGYRPITFEEYEKVAICFALARSGFIQTRAAEELGVSKRALCYKIAKYDINPKKPLPSIEYLRLID